MAINVNKLARSIIQNNQYVSIATVDEKGKPWISPVAYAHDNNWNLYFVSMTTSRHCINFEKNSNVAVAIFDSQQVWGEGVGLQIEGKVEVVKIKDVPKVIKLYAFRNYPFGGIKTEKAMTFAKSMVLERKIYKIYKIVPNNVYMNDPNSETDVRIKINL